MFEAYAHAVVREDGTLQEVYDSSDANPSCDDSHSRAFQITITHQQGDNYDEALRKLQLHCREKFPWIFPWIQEDEVTKQVIRDLASQKVLYPPAYVQAQALLIKKAMDEYRARNKKPS